MNQGFALVLKKPDAYFTPNLGPLRGEYGSGQKVGVSIVNDIVGSNPSCTCSRVSQIHLRMIWLIFPAIVVAMELQTFDSVGGCFFDSNLP